MSRPDDISDSVRRALDRYFRDLDGELPSGVYDMVLKTVERPLLETVMRQADGNQTLAAEMLGINRNTLRKKLNEHQLLD
ncbi:MAG TPA: Fis family transcriptional regulator [Rhodocyclaceae bacterium]|nr:Fis family transcriptional regulator [Rhodocyclaceae bacterium]